MGLLDIFKRKRKIPNGARIDDVLKRADETIARIEDGLEQMKRDDKKWRNLIGF